MPVVTTLHTVLPEPRAEQRRVMQELIALSTGVVVMAEREWRMLQDIYEPPPTFTFRPISTRRRPRSQGTFSDPYSAHQAECPASLGGRTVRRASGLVLTRKPETGEMLSRGEIRIATRIREEPL